MKNLEIIWKLYKWHLLAALTFSVLIVLVYQGWFNTDIITRGDWKARSSFWIADWFNRPFAWDTGDFGGVPFTNAGRIVRYPIYFLQAFLNQVLGIPYAGTERLLWFFPFLIVSALSIYALTKEVFKSKIAAFIAIFVFLFNNFVLFRAHGAQMVLLMSYALTPLAILFFVRALKGEFLKNILLSGLVMTLIGYNDVRLLVLVFAVMTFYGLYVFINNKVFREATYKKISTKSIVSGLLLIGGLLLVLNAFWLMPTFFSQQDIGFGGESFFNLDKVKSLSRTNFWHTLSLSIGNEEEFGRFVYLPGQLNTAFLFLMPLFAILPLFLARKHRKEIIFWTIIWVFLAFMAKGLNEPFVFLNQIFYEKVPLASMYRLPDKFLYVMATPFAMLYGLACVELMAFAKSIKHKFFASGYKFLVGFVFVFLPLLIVAPALFGQNNLANTSGGSSFKSFVPEQYFEADRWLNEQEPHYKTVWGQGTPRYDFFSFLHPRFEIRTAVQDQSLFGSYYLNAFNYTNPSSFLGGTKYLEKIKNFDKILALVNIKYFMLPPDQDPDWTWQPEAYSLPNYLRIFGKNNKLNLQKIALPESTFFETDKVLPKVFSPKKSMLVLGGGKALNYLLERDDVIIADWNFYFSENFAERMAPPIESIDAVLFFDQAIEDYVLNQIEDEYKINLTFAINNYHKKIKSYGELRVNNKTAIKNAGNPDIKQVRFSRDIETTEKYDVWARMAVSKHSGNLVEVLVDYENVSLARPDPVHVGAYKWFKLASLELDAGQRNFAFNFIVENVALDQVVILPSEIYVQKKQEVELYLQSTDSIFVASMDSPEKLFEADGLHRSFDRVLDEGKIEFIDDGQFAHSAIEDVKELGYLFNGKQERFVYFVDIGSSSDDWQLQGAKNLRINDDPEKVENKHATLVNSSKATKIFADPVDLSNYSHVNLRLRESVTENIKLVIRDVNDNSCHFSIKTPVGWTVWKSYQLSLDKCTLDQSEALDWKQVAQVGFASVYSAYQLSWDYIYFINKKESATINTGVVNFDNIWIKDSDGKEYKVNAFEIFSSDVKNEVPISYDGDYWFLFNTRYDLPERIYSDLQINGEEANLQPKTDKALLSVPISMRGGVVYTLDKQFISFIEAVAYSDKAHSNFFATTNNPIEILSWEMINPSKYLVKAKVNRPGYINLLDGYDAGWVASYDGQESKSVLLTTINNSFFVRPSTPGEEIDIYLEYEPQGTMDLGFGIFLLGLGTLLLVFVFGRKKGSVVIALIGPDGSGKSTYVDAVLKHLKKKGLSVEVRYPFNYFLLRKLIDLFKNEDSSKKKRKSSTHVSSKTNQNVLFKFWPLIAIIDNWLCYYFALRKKDRVIICDRYFHDLATSFDEFGYTFPWFYNLYLALIPNPDICFVLDAKETILQKRETGNTHERGFFRRQRKRYAEIAKRSHFKVIKTDKGLKTCKAEIIRMIEDKVLSK